MQATDNSEGFVVSLSPSRQMQGEYLKSDQHYLLPQPFQITIL
jgi:hypothetical protein